MAITKRHTDPGKGYDPSQELSNSQRQRFSEVANRAEEKREQREIYEAALDPRKARLWKAKRNRKAQNNPAVTLSKNRTKARILSFLRVLIWSITLGAVWLWAMFMFPS